MIQFLSLFSGIGAPEKALDRLGVEYNLVNYCEIDEYASKSYSAIHNIPESKNLGDITKVDTAKLPHIDMIFYGFPCQDISLAGDQKGFFDENGNVTRSGLFFEALNIIHNTQPKVAIAENVKNLTSKRFSEEFKVVLEGLELAGYNNYWQVLNAKDYGVPQNRERVFIVSIRKDLDTGVFKFPEPFELELRLKDLLDTEVDEKYYLSDKGTSGIINALTDGREHTPNILNENTEYAPTLDTRVGAQTHRSPYIEVKEATKQGYAEAYEGDSINLEQPNSKTRRGRVGKQVAQTLTTSPQQGVVEPVCLNSKGGRGGVDGLQPSLQDRVYDSEAISTAVTTSYMPNFTQGLRIRKLTPLECFRLMGFDDDDFYKAEKVNSNTQLYKQAGNSIVVDVLEYLFKEILEVVDMKKIDNKVTVFEGDDLINLVALKEKEPELYEELLADYPCEEGTYIFKNGKNFA